MAKTVPKEGSIFQTTIYSTYKDGKRHKYQTQKLLFFWCNDWSQRFWQKKLKLEKKNYKYIGIYYVGYITTAQFDEYNKVNTANPFYLMICILVQDILKNKFGLELNQISQKLMAKKTTQKLKLILMMICLWILILICLWINHYNFQHWQHF